MHFQRSKVTALAINLLLGTVAASAQPSVIPAHTALPTENVTVTGTKSRELLRGFVRSFTAPTRSTGKVGRWKAGICTSAVGLKPQFAVFISQHVKDIAKQAGAPVNDRASCTPNILIVFTTAPQHLLDDIRKRQPNLLGYYDNSAQLEALSTVTHPVQAWYMTATRDAHGITEVDSARRTGSGLAYTYKCLPPDPGMCTIYLRDARAMSATDSRLGDGLRSELYNVIIVADRDKLASYEIGPLSDYIAMLALAQFGSLDVCQQLPSIMNMLAPNCDRKSEALTEFDKAYLYGLYKATPDLNLGVQQDQVAYEMEQALKGR